MLSEIVGVVSWADGCVKKGFSTLFTRVAGPGVSTQIGALVTEASQVFNFPGLPSGVFRRR